MKTGEKVHQRVEKRKDSTSWGRKTEKRCIGRAENRRKSASGA